LEKIIGNAKVGGRARIYVADKGNGGGISEKEWKRKERSRNWQDGERELLRRGSVRKNPVKGRSSRM